jgi:hypothetical protein
MEVLLKTENEEPKRPPWPQAKSFNFKKLNGYKLSTIRGRGVPFDQGEEIEECL